MKNLLEKALGFDAKSMKLRTELIAGATTFLTMSYILAVNPTILSSTGMDKGALFTATALHTLFSDGLHVATSIGHNAGRGCNLHSDHLFQYP